MSFVPRIFTVRTSNTLENHTRLMPIAMTVTTAAAMILRFTDREAARVIRKVLASAVANAVNNDELDADDLYVKACYADEGPTLKRFTPRARGRAGSIMKRTCHITVVLDVLSEERQAVRDAKSMASRTPSSNRRARVAASRKPADAPKADEATAENTDAAEAATTEESES